MKLNQIKKEIGKPSLHEEWKKARKVAEKKANTSGKNSVQAKAFKALEKKFSMKLGSNLDKWITYFPEEYQRMKKLLDNKVFPALSSYRKEAKKSGLEDGTRDRLVKALNSIEKEQKKRDAKAENFILHYEKLAYKLDKQTAKVPPIKVFETKDIFSQVLPLVKPPLKNLKVEGKVSVVVIIDHKNILKNFPSGKEYANSAQLIKDAGNYNKLLQDIADGLKKADGKVKKSTDTAAREKDVSDIVDRAIRDCGHRASLEAARLGKLKSKVEKAHLIRTGKFALTFIGGMSKAAGLGVTGGVMISTTFGFGTFVAIGSLALGCAELLKTTITLLNKLVLETSKMVMLKKEIASDLKEYEKQYDKVHGVSKKLSSHDLVKSILNHHLGPLFKTLDKIQAKAKVYGRKNDELELMAIGKFSAKIDDWLEKQKEANDAIKRLKKLGDDEIAPRDKKVLTGQTKSLLHTTQNVDKEIKKVIEINKRVKENRKMLKKFNATLMDLRSKRSKWNNLILAVEGIGYSTVKSTTFMFLKADYTDVDVYAKLIYKSVTKIPPTAYKVTASTIILCEKLKKLSKERKKLAKIKK